jgi:hypothetical protein
VYVRGVYTVCESWTSWYAGRVIYEILIIQKWEATRESIRFCGPHAKTGIPHSTIVWIFWIVQRSINVIRGVAIIYRWRRIVVLRQKRGSFINIFDQTFNLDPYLLILYICLMMTVNRKNGWKDAAIYSVQCTVYIRTNHVTRHVNTKMMKRQSGDKGELQLGIVLNVGYKLMMDRRQGARGWQRSINCLRKKNVNPYGFCCGFTVEQVFQNFCQIIAAELSSYRGKQWRTEITPTPRM